MKFRYAFEKLVELKRNEKSQSEQLLASALGKLQHAESSLRQLLQKKEEINQRIHQEGCGKIAVSQLQQTESYLHFLDRQIKEKTLQIQQAHIAVGERQMELTEKMKEEKIWQKAKEKAYEQFTLTTRKKEQAELDEMAEIRCFHHNT